MRSQALLSTASTELSLEPNTSFGALGVSTIPPGPSHTV
jgi:hypothetical protein